MCGKAIEAICVDKTGEKTLHKGIIKLKELGIIDNQLYEWGEALRKERNIGAHATDDRICEQDASDILDFSIAITDYIYILSLKFDEYKKRKKTQTMDDLFS